MFIVLFGRITRYLGAHKMELKKLLAVAAFAASACFTSTVASAAPIAPAKDVLRGQTAGLTDQVHYRGFRHCHNRWGHRRCHGGYSYYRYGGPSIYLGFGGGRRHWGGGHRHHRH
jgi:hypothetical protein